MELENT
jgi:hypothetical protein